MNQSGNIKARTNDFDAKSHAFCFLCFQRFPNHAEIKEIAEIALHIQKNKKIDDFHEKNQDKISIFNPFFPS